MQGKAFSIAGRVKAGLYACKGMVHAFRVGHAIWVQSAIAFLVILLGFYVQLSLQDWRWIVIAVCLVWCAEIMNTALETVCDALHPDFHPKIGLAKDAAAGAVLIASIGASVLGILIFTPYFWR